MNQKASTETAAGGTCRIVHIVPRDFRGADDGGRIKTAALASALAAAGELHVVDMDRRPYAGHGYVWAESLALPFGGAARFYSSVDYPDPAQRQTSPLHFWRALKRSFTRRSRAHRARCALRIIDRIQPDLVVADDITGARVAAECQVPLRIIHTHNVESALHHALYARSRHLKWKQKAAQYESWERRLLPAVDQVWAVSEEDAAHYRAQGVSRLVITPNVIADERFEPSPTVGRAGTGIYFASLWYQPNRDAALYLAGMAARLRARLPALQLVVTGRGADAELTTALTTPGVELRGFVDSIRETTRDLAAVLVPLAWGGGTKVKTVEAMALGKPIVTTPEGAAGLALQDGVHALIRPLGEAFDTAVAEVLQQPQQFAAMGLAAQRLARDYYSVAALKRIVAAALAEVLQARRHG